jgi:hypothetical protein
MNDTELQNAVAIRRAVNTAFLQCGMRLLSDDAIEPILAKLTELGCTCDASQGYLRVTQGATEIAPSGMCERMRKDMPTLFVSDPKRDVISSLEDFQRGTALERAHARAEYITQYGLEAFESLPRTKADATRKNAPVSPSMTRSEWLALPLRERARLMGIFDADTLGRIMSRRDLNE